ncbi:hypothetical protein [Oceanobacillus chungangensis]|uniref:Oligosaccharide repeat unit polymerase n=1 Tax=Oceanobacillus chungangensis TaxID=1229152 RepID=A0A3D8Q174_9BACI|nr:hypothetical protein [Oceanobacillus chungangensis]RDW20755.1 hypothetical protein CWR45_05890 [Oceanobacillus chungangensis]
MISVYFIRMVISPLVMFLGNYSTFGSGYYLYAYLDNAILLMCYEAIVVFTFLIYKISNLKNSNNPIIQINNKSKVRHKIKLPILFKFIVFGLISFIILLILSDPTLLRSNFLFLIGTSEDWQIQENYASLSGGGSGTLGILVTLLNTVFWLVQALLPPIIMLKIVQMKVPYFYKLFLSLLLLSAVMLISTETRAHSIEVALTLVIIMIVLYGRRFTKFIPLLMITIVYITISGLFAKSGMEFSFEELSKTLTAYFSGPQNVAVAIGAAKDYSSLGIAMIPADIFMKIPYLSSFFEPMFKETTNTIFNVAYAAMEGRYIGQIIPSVGQGYAYFGFLLAPIIPCLAVWIAISFEKRARDTSNIVFKFIFYMGTIMMARVTVLSNMLSGVNYLFNIILTLLIAYISFKLIKMDKGTIRNKKWILE